MAYSHEKMASRTFRESSLAKGENKMNIALWIAQILLAIVYGMAGMMKAFQTAKAGEMLPWAKRHSDSFVRLVGASELLGALGMILPALTGILPVLTPLAAIGLSLIQILAILMEHLPNKEYKAIPFNVVLFVLSVFVAYGRLVVVPL
jgi:uncharacterized membrane protein YphA (DoxX/SURF4 family)